MNDKNHHKVFVVSAPSGAGKTTLNRRLISEHENIEISISLTTRPIRKGEVNGDHYHFVDDQEFMKHVDAGKMLEWAEVFGNKYGTSIDEIKRIHGNGHDVLLEIDVQGWHYARKRMPEATSVFILPPSIDELWSRLRNRGTDELHVRARRILTARAEIEYGKNFKHFIVNSDLDSAYQQLQDITIHDKKAGLSTEEGNDFCEKLLRDFDAAPWIGEIQEMMESQTKVSG